MPVLTVALLLVLILGIGFSTWRNFSRQKAQFLKTFKDSVEGIAVLKARQISELLQFHTSRMEVFSNNPLNAKPLLHLLQDPSWGEGREDILTWFRILCVRQGYRNVVLMDEKNAVVIEAYGPTVLHSSYPECARQALRSGKVMLSEIYSDAQSEGSFIDFAVPVQPSASMDYRISGTVCVVVDARKTIFPIVESGSGEKGKTLLIARRGNEGVVLSEPSRGFRVPLSDTRQAVAVATAGTQKSFRAVDCRGTSVLAAAEPVPRTSWLVLAEMDENELLLPLQTHARSMGAIAVSLVLITGLGLLLWWKRKEARLLQQKLTAEQNQRMVAQRFNYLTKYANDAILLFDSDFRVIDANDRALTMYGYRRDEMLGLRGPDLRTPEAMAEMENLVRQLNVEGGALFETMHRRKDGTPFPVEISTRVIEHDGETLYQAIIRDITERKEAEAAVRRNASLLNALFDSLPGPLFYKDSNGLFLGCNAAFAEFLGLPKERIIGKSVFDVYPDDVAKLYRRKDDELFSAGGLQVYETQAKYADGTFHDMEVRKARFNDENGRPAGIIGTWFDVTERKRSQQALRESEEKFRALVENTPDSIIRLDRNLRTLYVSPGTTVFTSMTTEFMTGKTPREMGLAEEHRAIWETNVQAVFDSGVPVETEYDLELSVGRKIIDWRLFPEFDADGTVASVLSIARDITAHRKMEHDYRSLFNAMINGFALHEIVCEEHGKPIDYRFLAVNPAFERLTGLSAKTLIGRTVLEVLPGTEATWIETYGRVALTGEPVHFEEYSAELGKYFEVNAYQAREGQFACIFADVTERKEAEKALRAKTEELDRFFSVNPDPLCITDFKGNILRFNKAWEAVLGYDSSEMQRLKFLDIIHPDDLYASRNVIQLLTSGEDIYDFVNRYRCKDGSYRYLEWRATPFEDRIYAAARDITERRKNEEERHKLEAQLTQAQKMESVGRLAGGVAHDFNNMLAIILGYLDLVLLDLPPDDTDIRPQLMEVQRAAARARDLTRQLLAFGRKQMLEIKSVNINDLVVEFGRMIRRLIGEDIEVATMLAPDVGEVNVDPTQIEQILMNLSVNARDAMEDGGKLTIETAAVTLNEEYERTHTDIPAGEYVMLAVSDTGHGMDAETARFVFEPFFTTKDRGKGTGLGLATVYGIVKQHGGAVWVYSEPGSGTTFKIYLPRTREQLNRIDPEASPEDFMTGSGTILVAEDDPVVRKLVCGMLAGKGYDVIESTDVQDAVHLAARKEPIHLLLTDVIMPGLSGKQVYERVAELQPGIKVLYMSGYTENVVAHHNVLDQGVNYLQKPFTRQSLMEKVRKVLAEG